MNIYQIITLYILHLHNVTCQLYLNKAGIKTTANAPRIQVTGSKWDFIQVHSLQRSCLYHLWSIHWKFPLIYHLRLPSSALIACLSSITYLQGKHVNFSFNAFQLFESLSFHTEACSCSFSSPLSFRSFPSHSPLGHFYKIWYHIAPFKKIFNILFLK